MYPLGMTRPLAVAVAIARPRSTVRRTRGLAHPATREACYRSGETVHFLGEGFTPGNPVSLSRDGTVFSSSIFADGNGKFDAELRLLQDQGRQVRTYTAANSGTQGPSASRQMTVSAVGVGLSPKNGPVSRRFRIKATGFTTGKVLWAHVVHKGSKRHLKIGRLRGACHDLTHPPAAAPEERPLR